MLIQIFIYLFGTFKINCRVLIFVFIVYRFGDRIIKYTILDQSYCFKDKFAKLDRKLLICSKPLLFDHLVLINEMTLY